MSGFLFQKKAIFTFTNIYIMAILKSTKNKIFSILNSNFNINDFDFEEMCTSVPQNASKINSLVIKHLKTGLEFRFVHTHDSYKSFYFSAIKNDPLKKLSTITNHTFTEEQIFHLFNSFLQGGLKEAIYEMEGPDLLRNYIENKNKLNLDSIDFNSQDNFEDAERKLIKDGLKEIKLLITEKFELTEAQNLIVNDRLNYLGEAVDRLNKTDWKGILTSTIFSIIIALSLDSQKGQMLWDLFFNLFNNIPGIEK